jgi:hypothetical protein
MTADEITQRRIDNALKRLSSELDLNGKLIAELARALGVDVGGPELSLAPQPAPAVFEKEQSDG